MNGGGTDGDGDGDGQAHGVADADADGRRRRTGGRDAGFADSLCPSCASHRDVETKTSRFLLCTALPVKYPRQPVALCPAYRRAAP
jgi:hypothetical protein